MDITQVWKWCHKWRKEWEMLIICWWLLVHLVLVLGEGESQITSRILFISNFSPNCPFPRHVLIPMIAIWGCYDRYSVLLWSPFWALFLPRCCAQMAFWSWSLTARGSGENFPFIQSCWKHRSFYRETYTKRRMDSYSCFVECLTFNEKKQYHYQV